MRGQAAIEYLAIFSAVLVIFAAVSTAQMLNPSRAAAEDGLRLSQARSAADSIAGAIDTVYADGPGAVMSVSFPMDREWGLRLDNSTNRIEITVRTSEGYEDVGSSLRYEVENYHFLPLLPSGTFTVIVEWPENKLEPEGLDGSAVASGKIYIHIRSG